MQQTTQPQTISVIIPVHNGRHTLPQCLEAVFQSEYSHFECILVDDGSTDGSPEAARRQFPIRLLTLQGGPHGPAHARNRGAEASRGDLLYFIDADVVIKPDTLNRIVATFTRRPDADALFGSYDEDPGGASFLAQYKNLFHHYVHQQGAEDAGTFWSGCGAIRRPVFLALGGFDAKLYPRPSIEDIELGYRLRAAGHKIVLDKGLQVKHLKPWSLAGMLKSDVLDRALPWTRLILRHQNLPDDLNLQTSQRVSAVLLCLLLAFLAAATAVSPATLFLPLATVLFLLLVGGWGWKAAGGGFGLTGSGALATASVLGVTALLAVLLEETALLVPLGALALLAAVGRPLSAMRQPLFAAMMLTMGAAFTLAFLAVPLWITGPTAAVLALIVILNRRLYRFFARKRGVVFALAVLPFQLLYYLYSVLTFIVGSGQHYWDSRLKAKSTGDMYAS